MMDEDLLLHELVDSEDDTELDLDMVFGEVHFQSSAGLLGAVVSKLGIKSNVPIVEGLESLEYTQQKEELFQSIVSLYSENEFLELFRVKHSVADILIKRFKSDSQHKDPKIHHVPQEVQVLSVLWYLGQETVTSEDLYSVFGLESAQFDEILSQITTFFCNARNKEINLPNGKEKRMAKKHFAKNHGFQGAIGCVGTVRIKVKRGAFDAKDVVVALQAVVNEKAKFTDVYVCDNTLTNSKVLLASPLYQAMPTICADGEYFVGGAGYPCLRYLLTPYSDPDTGDLTGAQIYFNLRLATSLQTTDKAFTLLTQRFRKLFNLQLAITANATEIITACCVLHNVANNDDFENIFVPPASNNLVDDECMVDSLVDLDLRNRVCQELSQE